MFMGLVFFFQVEKESSSSFICTIQNKIKKKSYYLTNICTSIIPHLPELVENLPASFRQEINIKLLPQQLQNTETPVNSRQLLWQKKNHLQHFLAALTNFPLSFNQSLNLIWYLNSFSLIHLFNIMANLSFPSPPRVFQVYFVILFQDI